VFKLGKDLFMIFGSLNQIRSTSKSLLLCAFAIAGALAANAQTLLIVSGNGQLVQTGTLSNQPLVVQLLDANGQPSVGQTVSFASVQVFPAGQTPPTAVTGANGQASVFYTGANLLNQSGNYVTNTVIASFGVASVSFTETTSNIASGGGSLLTTSLVYPPAGQGVVFSGPAGSTGAQPISITVGQINGPGVPGISLAIATDAGSGTGGTISCKEGPYVLTDANGNASCTPLFGKMGTGTFTIIVGGAFTFSNNQFTVLVGNPGIISIVSGNNQSGLPGQTLPLPIVATVSDLAGNLLTGVGVNFTSLTPGGATFTNVRNTTDANGRVSASVVLGTTAGTIQIQVADTGGLVKTPAVFTETVNINVSAITAISGGGQTTFINQAFAQPVVVQVNGPTQQPVVGATVTFAVTSGSATVATPTAVTGANGQASTTVTAGPNAGAITVTATATGGFSTSFSLTANPPGPTNFSYFNGASNAPNSLSPGSIVTITAQGLVGSNIQGSVSGGEFGPMPYQLAGVTVTIGGIPAPLFNVSNVNGTQSVTLQVPYEVAAGTLPIKIAVNGGGSNSAFVTVNAVSPGFFSSVQSDGVTRAIALRPNGTLVTPQNPAARGENIRVYLTGLGPVSPAVATGNFSPSTGSDPAVTYPLIAGINNNGVAIIQAIYARNLVGVYELTIQAPAADVAPSGAVPLSIAVQAPSGAYSYSDGSVLILQ
jgi:uncharacterized protein (TIGR03437 family)